MERPYGLPGTPLFPVSPERANQQKQQAPPLLHNIIASSPSMPNLGTVSRSSSDVQGKVAQFNLLSKDVTERRRENEAAVRRAVLGREEAENETRRAKEECRRLTRELEESRWRENKVAERLDRAMEELHRVKETHAHSQTLYEKEIRRSRKEAFKSSSVVVKLQEDSKVARESFKALQLETSQLRAKVDGSDRDAFTARYQLVGAQEELSQMRETLRLLRDEKDALKTSLKEEEVARVAAQGGIALPVGHPDDEFDSPRKRRVPEPSHLDQMHMVVADHDNETLARMAENLRRTRRRMQKAEGQVEHMKMECLFRCCSCRLADSKGETLTYDQALQGALSRKLGDMDDAMMEEVT